MYKVYCIKEKSTNRIVYVGMTRQPLSNRVYKHYREKGLSREEYTHELLAQFNDRKSALSLEKKLIEEMRLTEAGFNKVVCISENGVSTRFAPNNQYGKMGTKRVRCIDLNREYPSITECAKDLGLSVRKISEVCRDKRKTHGGFRFEFV